MDTVYLPWTEKNVLSTSTDHNIKKRWQVEWVIIFLQPWVLKFILYVMYHPRENSTTNSPQWLMKFNRQICVLFHPTRDTNREGKEEEQERGSKAKGWPERDFILKQCQWKCIMKAVFYDHSVHDLFSI